MRSTGALYFTILLLCTGTACLAQDASPIVEGEILVKLKANTSPTEAQKIHGRNGAKVKGVIAGLDVVVVSTPRHGEERHARKYRAESCVQFAEPNYLAQIADTVPTDPFFAANQWDMKLILAPAAWDVCKGSPSVVVAVLDTGVDYRHPDLASKIVPGRNVVAGTSDPLDDHGHGTSVAGIIGACSNNALGVTGLSWASPIMPVKVADATGSASYAAIASGIVYAADHGAKVINISIAGSSASSTLANAVNYAYQRGCLVVAASGNSGINGVCYPAACPNALAVGACDQTGQPASYSNYGSALDVIAPGGGYTTTRGGGYGGFGGTSAASPHAAGIAALVMSANPGCSLAKVVESLTAGTDDIGAPGWDSLSGWGRVNAYRALTAVTAPIGDAFPPCVNIASPAGGSTVSGTVGVVATVDSNAGISRVEFLVDGAVAGESDSDAWTWDTGQVENGEHTISARAYDSAGNAGVSSAVTVSVENPEVGNQTFTGSISAKSRPRSHSWMNTSTCDMRAALNWLGGPSLHLRLYDERNALVAESTQAAGSPAELSVAGLPAGAYKFEVSATSGKARYTLTVDSTGR